MLALMIIGGAQTAWGETTTLYERTSSTWTEDDIADWGNSSATISEGLVQKGTNASWSATKTLAFIANSKVTLTATLIGGAAPGRTGSYDYITIGGVSLRLDGQSSVASIDIDGTSTTLSGFTRVGTYNLTVTIDQATGDVTYNVTGGATGEGSGKTSKELGNVTVGHNKAGRENYEVSLTLSSIKVSEEKQTVETADYTINYLYNSETIKTDNGTTAVNNVVEATSPITIEGKKYYAVDGATTSLTVTNVEANNVLNVELRDAYEYNYTVNSNLGDVFTTGVSIEDETVFAVYPKYKNVDGTLYEAPQGNAGYYKCSFVPSSDNYVHTITYSATSTTDVTYFSEAEDIEGLTGFSNNNADIRCSNGTAAYNAGTSPVTITTLASGNYKLYTSVWGSSGTTITFKAGDNTILEAATTGALKPYNTGDINVIEETAITVEGGASGKGFDYVYIVKVPVTISLPADYVYSTFCSEYDLDFTDNTAVEAYIAYGDGENVYLEQVNRVPGGTGLVLKKLGDATTATVPVAQILELTKEEDETLSLNFLWPVLDGPISAEDLAAEGNAYILEDDYKFSKVVEGATGELAVGKAYLMYNAIGGGPLWIKIFDGEATAIKGVEVKAAQADNAIYNLQGVRVSKPTAKGLYIINGKKHLCK